MYIHTYIHTYEHTYVCTFCVKVCVNRGRGVHVNWNITQIYIRTFLKIHSHTSLTFCVQNGSTDNRGPESYLPQQVSEPA